MSTDTAIDLRPLGVVASAIAGRAVEIAAAEPGSRSWTDGRTIYVETGVDARDRLRLLGVQASLLAGDSLGPDVVDQLRRHRPLAQRYLAIEGHRALAANADALPPRLRSMIDHDLAGSVGSPLESLALARQERRLAPMWEFGTLDARRVAAPDHRADTGLASAADPARRDVRLELTDLEDLGDDEDDGLDLQLSSPVGGGGAAGRLLAKLLRPARSRDRAGAPGVDAPTHAGVPRPGANRSTLSLAPGVASLEDAEPVDVGPHSYPEWDERRQRYRPDWCQVVEDVAEAGDGPAPPMAEVAALRRALARLGMGLTPCRRQRQGDDLDLDAIVEARALLLAGAQGSDDLYIENLRHRRDLSVLVLLDISGSAGEPGVAGRTVHDHQRDAAAALTATLHRLGDRVALHAFSSRGRGAVRMTRVKGFDEPVDGRTARRLDGLRPGAYTRLGAAIRHGSAVLQARGGTPRRLLVVLSDGLAYDHGYEGRHGEADARRALLEARRAGIGCLCLSVGADTEPRELQRVFGTSAHAAVPTTEHLPESIGPLFAAALRSAEAQRRSFQRTGRTRARLQSERGPR